MRELASTVRKAPELYEVVQGMYTNEEKEGNEGRGREREREG